MTSRPTPRARVQYNKAEPAAKRDASQTDNTQIKTLYLAYSTSSLSTPVTLVRWPSSTQSENSTPASALPSRLNSTERAWVAVSSISGGLFLFALLWCCCCVRTKRRRTSKSFSTNTTPSSTRDSTRDSTISSHRSLHHHHHHRRHSPPRQRNDPPVVIYPFPLNPLPGLVQRPYSPPPANHPPNPFPYPAPNQYQNPPPPANIPPHPNNAPYNTPRNLSPRPHIAPLHNVQVDPAPIPQVGQNNASNDHNTATRAESEAARSPVSSVSKVDSTSTSHVSVKDEQWRDTSQAGPTSVSDIGSGGNGGEGPSATREAAENQGDGKMGGSHTDTDGLSQDDKGGNASNLDSSSSSVSEHGSGLEGSIRLEDNTDGAGGFQPNAPPEIVLPPESPRARQNQNGPRIIQVDPEPLPYEPNMAGLNVPRDYPPRLGPLRRGFPQDFHYMQDRFQDQAHHPQVVDPHYPFQPNFFPADNGFAGDDPRNVPSPPRSEIGGGRGQFPPTNRRPAHPGLLKWLRGGSSMTTGGRGRGQGRGG